ncbi:MAG: hypothetical protein Q8930_07025 [Bacillota bacterium]|nr:hypothetical protein [Bacillota bacterium]
MLRLVINLPGIIVMGYLVEWIIHRKEKSEVREEFDKIRIATKQKQMVHFRHQAPWGSGEPDVFYYRQLKQ